MRFFYPQPEVCFESTQFFKGYPKMQKSKKRPSKDRRFSKKKKTKLQYKTGHNTGLCFYNFT